MKNIDNKSLGKSTFFQLVVNIRTAEEVYKAAVYGTVHNETIILQILGKTGLGSSVQKLEKEKYKEAVVALKALSENDEKFDIDLSYREVKLMRKIAKLQLRVVKNIPQLAREQLIITFATLVEGYVNDTIKNFLRNYPQSLRSNKSTLKDNDLVDSIIEGNTLEKLIDNRVRDIMYDSISGWINYLKEKGFDIEEEKNLKEMFLVRNVLIHNNKKVGIELAKNIGGKRYTIGKQINITENDIKRFKKALKTVTKKINSEYLLKIN